jgi:hypothetical protein
MLKSFPYIILGEKGFKTPLFLKGKNELELRVLAI